MTITLNALQKQRRDTASNWTSNNTVLLAGEWGIESDTKKFKIGDGSTAWQSLDYVPIPDANRSLPGNLVVEGNFTVNGTTTTIDTSVLTVEDINIVIGKVSTPTDTTADGGGITLKGATDKTINWVDSTDSWTFSEHVDLASGKVFKINNSEILSATGLGSSVVSSSLTSVGTITSGTWNATAISGSKVTPDFGSQAITTTGGLSINGATVFNENGADVDFRIESDDNANMFFVDAGNNRIGIGTNSPLNNLHLHQADSEKCILQFTNTTTGTGATDGLHVGHVANENVAFWNHEDTDINIATDNTHRMVIKNDGLVGINLGNGVDPLELVHMKGNLYIVKNASGANEGNAIQFQTKTGGFDTSYGAAIHGLRVGNSSSYLRFDTGGQSEKMRLDEDGRLGIGTTNPTSAGSYTKFLQISDSNSASVAISRSASGSAHTLELGAFNGVSLIESTGNTSLKFKVNSEIRMLIDSSGRVLIGTTTEGSAGADEFTINTPSGHGGMTIRNDTSSNGNIWFSDGTSGSAEYAGYIQYAHNDDALVFGANADERMRIDSSGNVGIGTSSPTRPLHIASDEDLTSFTGTAKGAFCISNSDYANGEYSAIDFTYTTSDKPLGRIATKITSSGSFLSFGTSNTFFNGITNEAVIIDPSGNVGIGTSNPDRLLHLSGADTAIIRLENTDTSLTTNQIIGGVEFEKQDPSGGGVGVAGGLRMYSGVDGITTYLTLSTSDSSSNDVERLRINADGDVMVGRSNTTINTTNFGHVLFNDGTAINSRNAGASDAVMQSHGNAGTFRIMGDGDAENTNGRYTQISDIKYKENVVDANSQWDDIKAIKVRNFNFKSSTGWSTHKQIGIVAQELELTSPALVKTSFNRQRTESHKSVAQSIVYMKALKALQEAMAKIEVLETKVAALEAA